MLQRKALTHQHVRSRSCLLHGKRRRVRQRTRGEAVGQIALDLGPARHRHIPHHAQRPSCHGSVSSSCARRRPPRRRRIRSLPAGLPIPREAERHRRPPPRTPDHPFRYLPPVPSPRLNCLRRHHPRRCVDQADFSWQVRAVLGERGEQLASAPTTTPPVKAIAGPMDSVSAQTPTVVTSDISTRNSPSSTGVTSTPTSVTRIEKGVRRD
jgi:hypothetical protein